MYLNLDLLENIKVYFEFLICYDGCNGYYIFNKVTLKMVYCDLNQFILIDVLNKTCCWNFGGTIIKYSKNVIPCIFDLKKSTKKFKLPIPENDFLFNNIRLQQGHFKTYENSIKS